MKGIVSFSVIPVRKDPSHRSEMVNQLLFSDLVDIYDNKNEWVYIESLNDEYRGWCLAEQIKMISDEDCTKIHISKKIYCGSLVTSLESIDKKEKHIIPFGTPLPTDKNNNIDLGYQLFKNDITSFKIKNTIGESIIQTAKEFLNTPYLWGGKSIFGIDCSGYSQLVYAMHGISIKRDASQQEEEGNIVPCLVDVKPGDLAFFENNNQKVTHVGIMINPETIIHASGYVRISRIDEYGIQHDSNDSHTHRLKSIKRIIF